MMKFFKTVNIFLPIIMAGCLLVVGVPEAAQKTITVDDVTGVPAQSVNLGIMINDSGNAAEKDIDVCVKTMPGLCAPR